MAPEDPQTNDTHPFHCMSVELLERPKTNPIIIEGFPGFGFVATIAVEYLMDHLKMRSIGRIWSPELAPMALVHNKRIIQPLEIFYSDKLNIIILEAVAGVAGMEWEVAEAIRVLAKELNAKEVVGIEGIGAAVEREEAIAYYYTNQEEKKKIFEKAGAKSLVEGIIFGVSGALMVRLPKEVKASFIFAETHSNLPDSRAAAKIIEILDRYLKLDIDYKPLLKKATEFEERLKGILEQTREAVDLKRRKETPQEYIG